MSHPKSILHSPFIEIRPAEVKDNLEFPQRLALMDHLGREVSYVTIADLRHALEEAEGHG